MISTASPTVQNWTAVTESGFAWERDALEFVKGRFPAHEPYRAWSNFEFIAEDGSVNEVDLLVFTPVGLFLVEIKSHPGRLSGDAGTWTWESEGRKQSVDNPLLAANGKAKRLRSLLQRQRAARGKGELPFIEPLIFCSAPDLIFDLTGVAASRVCLRDRESEGGSAGRPGILGALKRRECPGLEGPPKGVHDTPTARVVAQAIEQAGIRASQKARTVSDHRLVRLIGEGPGYQDWLATHVKFDTVKRRVRLYHVRGESTAEDRGRIERAAQREFEILESLQHPGVLRTYGFSEHELGPALIFEHEPLEIRLDHYLAQNRAGLPIDIRLDLVRQIAEVVQFAHEKKVVHRGLAPQSILVMPPGKEKDAGPRIKLLNWQLGYRESSSTAGVSRSVAPTTHIDRLVDDAGQVYLAPEAVQGDAGLGEHVDVFSLGALAYHIFSGEPPAASAIELNEKLRESNGLAISGVVNGAGPQLQDLIKLATHPEVPSRLGSAGEFLELLEAVEDELTEPEQHFLNDPSRAQRGDVLAGNFQVVRRLGQGACSIGFLVERDGLQYVLKVASSAEQSPRIRDEAEVLEKLRHQYIVELLDTVEIGEHAGFLMRPVYSGRDDQRIETLGQRLRKEGRLQLELLQRFGDDLLGALQFLEEQGIPHRDIKPDNIAVGFVGRGDVLHAVLFDFSLARTSADRINAGTHGYLDPMLPQRKPARWDLHAERYAMAATLYELATGTLPVWGDGLTAPQLARGEAKIDAELFEPALRESFTAFFTRAFRRDIKFRFDNAEEMHAAWKQCFVGIEPATTFADEENEDALRAHLAEITLDSHVHELGLGTRATNALDRANILSVEDLLGTPMRRLLRLRGVGNKTRREIATAVRLLRERFGASTTGDAVAPDATGAAEPGESLEPGSLSVDLLYRRLLPKAVKANDTANPIGRALLGLDERIEELWPRQSTVATRLDANQPKVSQVLGKFLERWGRDAALGRLRDQLAEVLAAQGGAMAVGELAEAIISARGCVEDEPRRSRMARAVLRAAVEAERTASEPRFGVRRDGARILIATGQEVAAYAFKLGDLADRLAAEDPLLAPARSLQRLRELTPPAGFTPVSDTRLVRLAVAASGLAALSSRQELYPRNLDPARALKLAQGAIYGVPNLSVAVLRERVRSRYPDAAPLPDRPALDTLLEQAGIDLKWDPNSGTYTGRAAGSGTISSTSRPPSRRPTADTGQEPAGPSPEVADAREFEQRLRHGLKQGSFYALLVDPKSFDRAVGDLTDRFGVERVDLEGLMLDAMREVAEKARVRWDLVVATDARPHTGDWGKLELLINRALPLVEARLLAVGRPMLLIFPGLLARYGKLDLLERLRDGVGRLPGLASVWLLLPGDHQAEIDGQALPLLGPGQKVRIPASWLANAHRAVASGGTA